MYLTSLQLFISLRVYVAIAVVGELAIQLVGEAFDIGGGLAFASILIWSYLAFNAHAALLLPQDRDKATDNTRVLGFALRAFGLGILMLVPVVAMIVLLLSDSSVDPRQGRGDLSLLVTIGLSSGLAFLLIFGYLGTLLPAFVADRNRGLGPALSRGMSQFF